VLSSPVGQHQHSDDSWTSAQNNSFIESLRRTATRSYYDYHEPAPSWYSARKRKGSQGRTKKRRKRIATGKNTGLALGRLIVRFGILRPELYIILKVLWSVGKFDPTKGIQEYRAASCTVVCSNCAEFMIMLGSECIMKIPGKTQKRIFCLTCLVSGDGGPAHAKHSSAQETKVTKLPLAVTLRILGELQKIK
jgi:hypothetical protein